MKATIRAAGIKGVGGGRGGLGASEAHGKRLDETSQRRIVTERNSLSWSKAGKKKSLDLVEAFRTHKKKLGAVERGNTEIGTHLIAIVPPEWLAETGGVHDAKNPRIQKLIDEAVAWAESWQDEGAVYAWRFDLDEKGSGVVDLFTAPVREQGRRNGKKVKTISPSMAKKELTRSTGEKTSGAAMQTSWSSWAKERLDDRFERGTSRKITGRDHIHAEIYAETAEKARSEALKDIEREKLALLEKARSEALRDAQRLKMEVKREISASVLKEMQESDFKGLGDKLAMDAEINRQVMEKVSFDRGLSQARIMALEKENSVLKKQVDYFNKFFERFSTEITKFVSREIFEKISSVFSDVSKQVKSEQEPIEPVSTPKPSGRSFGR